MIVFGGAVGDNLVNDGGRFNPTTGTWTSLSVTNAPAARTGHSAVWTGTEMIVWGGRDSVGFDLATGGRFNPATNTWTSFPAVAGAPGLRSQHTAVWSGTEMIVWGGERSNVLGGPITYLNDGGRYNPSTNTWTALPVLGAPSDRVGHAAVWAGAAGMIVWGGDGSGSTGYLANGGQWRSSGWTLLFEAGAPERRHGHSTVWTGTEMIMWGGYGYDSCCFGGGRFVP
jgi:N-acetylneuraminic acid mutarotase